MDWWFEMGQICIDLSKLFWWMDMIGFFLAGLGALFILASVAFTGAVKNGGIFDKAHEANEYVFSINATKPWLRKFV